MFWKTIFAFLLYFFSLVSGFQCPPKSVIRDEKCYKFHPELSSYFTAKLSCSILGGNLAAIPNEEMNFFFSEESRKHFAKQEKDGENEAWIGGELPKNSAHWKWNDKNGTFQYSNFEHVNTIHEHQCLALNFETKKWNFHHCEAINNRKPYICEYDLALTNSTTTTTTTTVLTTLITDREETTTITSTTSTTTTSPTTTTVTFPEYTLPPFIVSPPVTKPRTTSSLYMKICPKGVRCQCPPGWLCVSQ